MNDNSYISIEHNKKTKKWDVWHKDADTDSGFIEHSHDTRDEAIDSTNDIYSEYGLCHIDEIPELKKGMK